MAQWLNSLNPLELAFAYMAVAGTVALAIQTVLLLIGVGHHTDADAADTSGLDGHDLDHDFDHDFDDDFDHDFDHDHDFDQHIDHDHDHDHGHVHHEHGLRLLTLRGIVAFFTITGWSALAMLRNGFPSAFSVVAALMLGVGAMALMALAIRQMARLETSGSIDLRNAIGRSAVVYISIPPERSGTGKVSIVVQQRLIEADAMTDAEEPLKTGAEVVVTGLLGLSTLIVSPGES